jgi:hypothetical protein
MRQRCEATVAARSGHTRYWTPQTSILHDNFCLSMICSDNAATKFCWYNVQLVTDPVIMPAKEEHDVILVQKVLTIVSHVIS